MLYFYKKKKILKIIYELYYIEILKSVPHLRPPLYTIDRDGGSNVYTFLQFLFTSS